MMRLTSLVRPLTDADTRFRRSFPRSHDATSGEPFPCFLLPYFVVLFAPFLCSSVSPSFSVPLPSSPSPSLILSRSLPRCHGSQLPDAPIFLLPAFLLPTSHFPHSTPEGCRLSAKAIFADSGLQNSSITVAHSLGISPAIVANPVARMPTAAVEELISKLSLNAKKAQHLALAGVAASNINDAQFLTAVSVKRLDDDLRTVHANTVLAAENINDNEGWMRWVRYTQDKDITEVKIMLDAFAEVLMPHLDDAAKAKVGAISFLSGHCFQRS